MKNRYEAWEKIKSWLTVPERLVDLAVLLACLLAFWHGWRATHDLHWPPDFDLYRDASIAQTMLDGGGLSDPAYAGERLWYNPLVPAIVAGLSRLTGWLVPIAYARVGVYLNLLAPVCFYVMVAHLLNNRLVAAASTLAFLFVTCQFPASRACATYSPWLFTANFAQTGFYLSTTLYSRALQRDRRPDFLLVGLMLGLTFLAHTAPALILGSIIGLHGAWAALRNLDRSFTSPRLHETVTRLLLIVGTALVVSYPYWRIILGHYRLYILNPAPNSWIYSELKLENLLTLIHSNLALPNLIAMFGMITLWVRPREQAAPLLTLWLIVCLIFIGFSDLSQVAARLDLPTFHALPPIHFLFYLKALVSVLFGYGLLALTRFLLEFAQYTLPILQELLSNLWQVRVEKAILILITLLAALKGYDSFVAQPALNETSERARAVIPSQWHDAYTWIRAQTVPSDVFLASPYFGLHIVTAAGRKVVALKPVFSNPFIDAATRLEYNALLYEHLQDGEAERFAILASAYDVKYVVTTVGDFDEPRVPPACLKMVFENEEVTIYEMVKTSTQHINLGEKMKFLGSILSWPSGEPPRIDLYLKCIAPMKKDYTLWFHATNDDRTTNFDHVLQTSEWQTGQVVTDTVTLDLPPGMYDLSFGLWMWQDGQRLWRKDNDQAGIHLSPIKIRGAQ